MAQFNSGDVLSLCKRRGFLYPSYEIYGGLAGFYDYGPLGVTMKQNIIDLWRSIYVLEEGFIEIDSDIVGPEMVFKASGHAENFQDLMVTCKLCGEGFRADHLAQDFHPNPGALSKAGPASIDPIGEHHVPLVQGGPLRHRGVQPDVQDEDRSRQWPHRLSSS